MPGLPISTFTSSEEEAQQARNACAQLLPFAKSGLTISVPGSPESVELGPSSVRLLTEALSFLAEGNSVTLIPTHAELTTQQAADLLGVSRPFLIKKIDSGIIPHRKVGKHRRILLRDILFFKQRNDSSREDVLDQLTADAQDLDMGY